MDSASSLSVTSNVLYDTISDCKGLLSVWDFQYDTTSVIAYVHARFLQYMHSNLSRFCCHQFAGFVNYQERNQKQRNMPRFELRYFALHPTCQTQPA